MPSKIQTRKSVSISGVSYKRVLTHCTRRKQSVSSFIEMLVCDFFHVEVPKTGTPKAQAKAKPKKKSHRRIVDEDALNVRHFECASYKKEALTKASPKPITGGGVHQL